MIFFRFQKIIKYLRIILSKLKWGENCGPDDIFIIKRKNEKIQHKKNK